MDPGLIFPSLATANVSSALAKIIGGTDAFQNEFFHQVSLQTENDKHFCGGSIISTMIILTAAHCIQIQDVEISEISIVAGAHNLSDYHGTEQVRKIGKAVIHENYDETTTRNDIAILILQKPFLFNDYVGRIEWPRHKMEWTGEGTAIGWGYTDPVNRTSENILKKVKLPIVPLKKCRKMNRGTMDSLVTDKNMCAGQDGHDTCQGDSGGALICSNPYNSEQTLKGKQSTSSFRLLFVPLTTMLHEMTVHRLNIIEIGSNNFVFLNMNLHPPVALATMESPLKKISKRFKIISKLRNFLSKCLKTKEKIACKLGIVAKQRVMLLSETWVV